MEGFLKLAVVWNIVFWPRLWSIINLYHLFLRNVGKIAFEQIHLKTFEVF